MDDNFELIAEIAERDVQTLKKKGETYGDSWRRRGGVGAFMMAARKMDRLENIAKSQGYDIFSACADNIGEILDDMQDLRAYLLLIEAHVYNTALTKIESESDEQLPRTYINPDL